MKKLYRLIPIIKNYEWGKRNGFNSLNIVNTDGQPQAELWLGTHEAGIAMVEDDVGKKTPLNLFLAANPSLMADKQLSALNFIFKILAVQGPLSLQVHPKQTEAEAGFSYENNLVKNNLINRNYVDSKGKNEIVCALSKQFWLLCGFKPCKDILITFKQAGFTTMADNISRFEANQSEEGLKAFFSSLFLLEPDSAALLITEALNYAALQKDAAAGWVIKLHKLYPHDVCILAPLFLNLLLLNKDEALYIEANTLHCYLEGMAVEVVGNSDNVLRAGLTKKYTDINELIKITNFTSLQPNVLQANSKGKFITANKGFVLQKITVPAYKIMAADNCFSITMCLAGSVKFASFDGSFSLTLKQGEAILIPAGAGGYQLEGEGELVSALMEVN
ncbi:MAG: mannose-6-phosphate isomerase, class I [Spirochaetaceae bacterium]|nr:mannose-6-phosphate isomerase, class I [Spirochaetaceae bacterium]